MNLNPLNQHEINRLILAKDAKKYPETEYLSISGRYRDQDYEIYKLKKKQFLESVKEYKELNENALKTCKIRTDIEGDKIIKAEYLQPHDEVLVEDYKPNTVLRKRILRPIHANFKTKNETTKTLEPWFIRHIVLNRFIQIVRKLVIKTRLLKRLEILKRLTRERVEQLENMKHRVTNVSYSHLFDKFLS